MLRSVVFHLLLLAVQGFVVRPPGRRGLASRSALEMSSSGYSVPDDQRRDLFASILATGLAAVVFAGSQSVPNVSSRQLATTETLITYIDHVDQALQWIDAECDRRFLHAVVASDYKLLYKGLSSVERISLCSSPEDLLQSEDAILFRTLEKELQHQPIQPSTSRIAVANPVAAQRMGGTVCSIWPLGQFVHYAWLENGTSFRGTWDTKMIVDGVDCGRMSLEDALEGNKEILFRSERYLAVPVSMEKELVRKLKGLFII